MGFCSNCGAQVPDGAAACPACGAAQSAPVNSEVQQSVNFSQQGQYGQPTNTQPKTTGPNPVVKAWKDAEEKLGATKLFGVCVGVVVLLIVVMMACSANAYKSPIKKYYSGYKTLNAKKTFKAYDKKIEDELYMDEDDLDDYFDDLEEDDYKLLSYKIIYSYKLDKEMLEDVADILEDVYDYEKKVSEAYLVHVRTEYEKDDEKYVGRDDFFVYKTRGKWFLLSD